MALIRPFAAYRYDLGKVKAADVLTQPYDKITPDMRTAYLARSPYNLVRIILGERQPDDHEGANVYTRAADFLQTWIRNGILRRDPEPGIYPYLQTFQVPGGGGAQTRRGFIALGHLEDYDRHIVFRHEQTLRGPKLDRQALLRATHTHFGQLFMMYSDPSQAAEAELFARAQNPILEATDEHGTRHRLFRETDGAVIDRLQHALAPRPLIIADGHHRYETALAWRNEQNARAPQTDGAPWDWVMMTLVNLDAPGLVVLPTHRLLHGLAHFDAGTALARLGEWFEIEPVAGDWPALRERMARTGALGLALSGRNERYTLRLRATVDLAAELPEALAEQRSLEVLQLHEFALARALEISAEAVREERNLRYVREAEEALESVRVGAAQAAFFLNPIAPAQVRDVALAGGVMPQKSTDFFPKLLSGLTLYRAE